MFQPYQKQLASYLIAGLGAGSLAMTAEAVVVTFSNSGSFIEGTVNDGDEPTITVALPDTTTLYIDGLEGGHYLELIMPPGGTFTGTGTLNVGSVSFPDVSLLAFGDPILPNLTPGSSFPSLALLTYGNAFIQPDFVGDVAGYLGFVTAAGNKGWLKVAFNSTTGLFSFNGGALASPDEPFTAGQTVAAIPEPASVLGTIGLLSAGMFVRRRRLAA